MKKILIWLERPKIVIPTVFIIAIIVGFYSFKFIGQAPVVNLSDISSSTILSIGRAEDSVELSFPKAGRLASLSVGVGDPVRQGDILASLDAADALGAVIQTKGTLELAKAQYASLNVQYANVKTQQDVLVANAYRTLLTSGLSAVAHKPDYDTSNMAIDSRQVLQITGTYTCGKEGNYEINPYPSEAGTGYSFTFQGLEKGSGDVTYYTPQPLGSCGLFVQFPVGYSAGDTKWVIDIPNTKSANYAANRNAYDLAVANRDQVLKQLEANLGQGSTTDANIAQAAVDAAQGAYEVALANYQNDLIVAPANGIVTFIDSHLKVGQAVTVNKTVITIAKK